MRAIIAIGLLASALTLLAAKRGGTGVWIVDRKSADEPLRTGKVWPSSPADKAGIKPGWFFISVDSTNVVRMPVTDVVRMIRGPVGTIVTLEIADLARSKTNQFKIRRGKVVIENNRVVKITDP